MKKKLSAVLLMAAILSFGTTCKKQVSLSDATERIRAFAESSNPELRDQPLVITLAKKKGKGVCICIKVCTKSGTCTACSCDPPKCGSCVNAAEVAPVESVFEAAR